MSDNLRLRKTSNIKGYGTAIIDTIDAILMTVSELAHFLTYRSDLYRSRQQLRDLSDEHLRDIGLTRRQAEAEASRPFLQD